MSVLRALSYADKPGSWPSLLGRGPPDLSLLLIPSPLGKTGVRLLPPTPPPPALKGRNHFGVSVWVLSPQ